MLSIEDQEFAETRELLQGLLRALAGRRTFDPL